MTVLAGSATADPIRLIVQSASLDFRTGGSAGGQLIAEGRFTGFKVDPEKSVGLFAGGRMRWIQLGQSGGSTRRFSGGSDEDGYSLSLDLDDGHFVVHDSGVMSRRQNPVLLRLTQGNAIACTMLEFTRAGDRWTFDERRNTQRRCD